ncbi:MAG TPA: hypothetical protein VFU35_14750 [Jatrophihabitans sp.]|nr:hypothetical protein [Jatrophihabitans sp.]
MLVVPIGGLLTDRLGVRPLMISGVATVAVAFGWLAAVVRPGVPYLQLVPALILAAAGVLAAAALPRLRAANAPECLPRWDTDVRGAAVPAGTAG